MAASGPPKKIAKVAADVSVEILPAEDDVKSKLAEELSKIRMVESQEISLPATLKEGESVKLSICHNTDDCGEADMILSADASKKPVRLKSPQKKGLYVISSPRTIYRYMSYLQCKVNAVIHSIMFKEIACLYFWLCIRCIIKFMQYCNLVYCVMS